MDERFLRTEMLLGPQAMERLAAAHVAVFGLGGVGSWCAEALARSGVGALTLVDHDTVGLTNLNRQILQLGNGQQHTDDHANPRGDNREQQGHFQSIQQVLIAIVLNDGQENRIGKGLDDVLKSIHYGVQESASSQITDRQKSRPPKRPALFII